MLTYDSHTKRGAKYTLVDRSALSRWANTSATTSASKSVNLLPTDIALGDENTRVYRGYARQAQITAVTSTNETPSDMESASAIPRIPRMTTQITPITHPGGNGSNAFSFFFCSSCSCFRLLLLLLLQKRRLCQNGGFDERQYNRNENA